MFIRRKSSWKRGSGRIGSQTGLHFSAWGSCGSRSSTGEIRLDPGQHSLGRREVTLGREQPDAQGPEHPSHVVAHRCLGFLDPAAVEVGRCEIPARGREVRVGRRRSRRVFTTTGHAPALELGQEG
jgi:hypothetical protein